MILKTGLFQGGHRGIGEAYAPYICDNLLAHLPVPDSVAISVLCEDGVESTEGGISIAYIRKYLIPKDVGLSINERYRISMKLRKWHTSYTRLRRALPASEVGIRLAKP